MHWHIKAITQKLADVDEEDDNNMQNCSRGYDNDVNNSNHVRKRSESGPNSRRREPCDPHFFFIRGALRHLVVHFSLFGRTHNILPCVYHSASGTMTKKLVKLLKSSDALNLDEVKEFNLTVDGHSQDGQSLTSKDVSNYDGNPKPAPQ